MLITAAAAGIKAQAAPADTEFEALAAKAIADELAFNPESATELGDHRYDGNLTDYSSAALAAKRVSVRELLDALHKIDFKLLTGANRIDARILETQLRFSLFSSEKLRPEENNPLYYHRSLAAGVYALTEREFAPAAVRLRSVASRLAGIPRVLEQAKANLKNPPRVHTETAIQQIGGAIAFIRDELGRVVSQAPEMKASVAPEQAKALAALTQYKTWLETELLPRSTGDFRLGAERYREKLRFALDSDLTPEAIATRARAELARATEEIRETARPLFDRYFPHPDPAVRADPARMVKAVLDRLGEKSLTDETVVDHARHTLDEATAFVRDRQLVSVPTEPLKIIVAPEFSRGVSVAYCDSPGALEKNGETFYAIAPAPAEWTPARKVSYYREYNAHMLYDLTVHEAMPGHYLQLAHANRFRGPTLIRAMFSSGSFIEGWAVYCEQLMAHEGFGGPEVKMQQLKMRLRMTINALLDQGVHAGSMTEQEALDLMIKQGFQEEGEAIGKWKRARLTSTQLSTYFVGAIEHDDLRAAAEKKWGSDFTPRKYHDAVLSFGSPPAKFVREELGL